MIDQNPIQQAQKAVEHILNALGVARVVYVDDAHNILLADVIAASISLAKEELYTLFPELGEVIPDDPDVLRQKVQSVWEQIDPKMRILRGQAILITASRQDGTSTDDIADASIVNDLVGNTKIINLTPEQWEVQREQLLQDNQNHRTLFLFDRHFKGVDTDGGIKIIASLLARTDVESLICGLLTHTVTPETQPEKWAELSKTHQIPKDRFVIIPKLHLSQDPILFAQTLKFAALSADFDELKRRTKAIIAEAATAAADQVEEVNIYDLEHIVFQVSADEGMWEPDMLFRLHALFHRLESRRLAHEGGNLESIAAKLRAVSGIPMNGHTFSPPSSAWVLQREELYEFDSHINKNHLPLELGDIFERVGASSTKKYILLAQPCDLMVRGRGIRRPELHRVPIAEIVCTDKPPRYSEEMPYFDESPTNRWYVNLKQVHFVSTHILDLCVFNPDGAAKLNVTEDVLPGIRPAWKERHRVLTRLCSQAIQKADMFLPLATESQAVKHMKQQLAPNFKNLLFKDDLFKGTLTETNGVRTVTYDCKRVRRLSRARALGLLMSYTSTIGRPAYDREFGPGKERVD